MALTESTIAELGRSMPPFALMTPEGKPYDSSELKGQPVLVAFICNHCPYVKHLADEFSAFCREYQAKGLKVIAINSNDYRNYPDDSPANMRKEIQQRGYSFPYLVDETQLVAQAFGAVCTPDFFLYNVDHKLIYRGQFDDSRPGKDSPVTGSDLREAADAALLGQRLEMDQTPSIGCNIKWRAV